MNIFSLILLLLYAWINRATACTAGGAQPDTGRTSTGLQAALGGDVRAEPYTTGANGNPIQVDTDIFCKMFDTTCRWKNTAGDQLDWTRGRGRPDPQKFEFATGTNVLPEDPYLILASNTRGAAETGILTTDPINCQVGNGRLTFRHWISRANSESQRPKLNVCWRYVGSTELKDCREAIGSPGPTTVNIPEITDAPFEVVFAGNNFVHSPLGGFIIVDDVEYIADVRNDCDGAVTDPVTEEPQPPDTTPDDGNYVDPDGGTTDEESCALMSCDFNLDDEFCAHNPIGEGAVGAGQDQGWVVTTGRENRANPLTGIKFDPERSRDGPFLVSTFLDPRQSIIDDDTQFVLESPQLNFQKEYFLSFQRYLATEGTQLKICRDAAGFDCLWESDPLIRGQSNALKNRQWTDEIIRVPRGKYKLYTIAAYDRQNRKNAGQVGLTRLEIFRDSRARDPLC